MNGEMLTDYLLENKLICLNTRYQKRKGQLWTHTVPNGSYVQLDYIMIHKKWKISSKNCSSYNAVVNVASDHRIVIEGLQLCLRSNKNKKLCNSI